jgi:hypothetical protein
MFIRAFSFIRNAHPDKDVTLRNLPVSVFWRKKKTKTKTGRFRSVMLLWCCVFVITKCSDEYSRQTYVKAAAIAQSV